MAAADAGQRTALVDGDPLGGGLDLLFGAEHVDGWRWPRLADARGHLGDLTGQLPYVDGVDLLAAARRGGSSGSAEIGPDQMAAVLRSTTRSHDLTVVDLPRWLSAGSARRRTRRADLTAARRPGRPARARGARASWWRGCPSRSAQVLLRSRRSAAVGPELVEESLGLPVLATITDEAAVRLAAERGEPPSRSARSASGEGLS